MSVHSLDVHLVGLSGLLQLRQDLAAAPLGGGVHLENLPANGAPVRRAVPGEGGVMQDNRCFQ